MKRLILLVATIGTTSLFAQMKNESFSFTDMSVIQKNFEKQNKEIDTLKHNLSKQFILIDRI